MISPIFIFVFEYLRFRHSSLSIRRRASSVSISNISVSNLSVSYVSLSIVHPSDRRRRSRIILSRPSTVRMLFSSRTSTRRIIFLRRGGIIVNLGL